MGYYALILWWTCSSKEPLRSKSVYFFSLVISSKDLPAPMAGGVTVINGKALPREVLSRENPHGPEALEQVSGFKGWDNTNDAIHIQLDVQMLGSVYRCT